MRIITAFMRETARRIRLFYLNQFPRAEMSQWVTEARLLRKKLEKRPAVPQEVHDILARAEAKGCWIRDNLHKWTLRQIYQQRKQLKDMVMEAADLLSAEGLRLEKKSRQQATREKKLKSREKKLILLEKKYNALEKKLLRHRQALDANAGRMTPEIRRQRDRLLKEQREIEETARSLGINLPRGSDGWLR